jgi:hypothetical protein
MKLNNLLNKKNIIIIKDKSNNLKFNKKITNATMTNIKQKIKVKKRFNDFFIILQIKFAYKTHLMLKK